MILKFDDEQRRNEFVSDLEHWLRGPNVRIRGIQKEVREKNLLALAVTKDDRQQSLERFFKMAFAQVCSR